MVIRKTMLFAAVAIAFGSTAYARTPSLDRAIVLPQPDIAAFVAEDGKRLGGAFRYGVQVGVQGASTRGKGLGQWSQTKDGHAVWTARIVSPGAKSLDFHFDRFVLPAGAEMKIRNADGSVERGVFTSADMNAEGGFYSPYVTGDDALIEIRVPVALKSAVDVNVASATHAYRGLFTTDEFTDKSGSCNVDVACPAGTGRDNQIDSVGHYTFSKSGSSYVCTGTLIANTSNTTTPHFLTANHCISTQTVASTIVVYWNYQSATCRTPGSTSSGTPLSRSIATHNQSGSTLVATNAASDFALLRLSSNVPAGADAYFAGWDNRNQNHASAYGIHHPAGHEKRIAVENAATQISGYNGASGTTHLRIVDWDQGTTEGGSSGSGLFSPEGRLIGQLHGGSAACGNDLSDYYGRLAVSWTGGGTAATRLRDHLDPGNTGATTKDGYRNGTIVNPKKFENLTDYTISDNTTVDSPVTVTGVAGNAPSTLKVNVNILHTYRGDLKVDVVAPDGTLYNISNRAGGSADNLIGTYTINASSEVANGTWKLRVNDNAAGDVGKIDSWSLEF